MQLKPIDQQVVAIVGASSGIGRETAIRFAKKGAKVVVSARSKPGLESFANIILLKRNDFLENLSKAGIFILKIMFFLHSTSIKKRKFY